MKYIFLIFMILSSFGMCFWTFESTENGETVVKEKISHYQVHKRRFMSKPFKIEKPNQTIRVKLKSNLKNQWMYFGVALHRLKDNKIITADDKEIQFYSGYEGGEHWTEGSNTHKFDWKLKQTGDYRVLVYVQQTSARNISIGLQVNRDYRENWPFPFLTGTWFLSIWFYYKAVIKD